MGDLRTNSLRMAQLISFIRSKEGDVDHFYCDENGFVTIGVGYLIDSRGGLSQPQVAGMISQLLRTGIVFYHRRTSSQATLQDVIADWYRVKSAYSESHQLASFYSRVAQLYITSSAIATLLQSRINEFINQLYLRKPFAINLDELIQMAIIDARFNPARVELYSTSDPGIVSFWEALDSNSSHYNLNQALNLFQQIWRGRGRSRYRQRHGQRIIWFQQGVQAMLQPSRIVRGRARFSASPPSYLESLQMGLESDLPSSMTNITPDLDSRGIISRGIDDRGL
ncbi:MAG: hypothetical protein ACRC8A_10630 [Microcoleaceae cyanobacterium]